MEREATPRGSSELMSGSEGEAQGEGQRHRWSGAERLSEMSSPIGRVIWQEVLESELGPLKREVEALRKEVGLLKQDHWTMRGDIRQDREKASAATAGQAEQMGFLRARLDGLSGDVASYRQEVQKGIADSLHRLEMLTILGVQAQAQDRAIERLDQELRQTTERFQRAIDEEQVRIGQLREVTDSLARRFAWVQGVQVFVIVALIAVLGTATFMATRGIFRF